MLLSRQLNWQSISDLKFAICGNAKAPSKRLRADLANGWIYGQGPGAMDNSHKMIYQ